MNRTRLVVSLVTAGALFLALAPASAWAQQATPPPPPKKPRKVWTEEDLEQLQGGVNVVGTSLNKPEEAKPGQAPVKEEPKNFYSDLSLEERQKWIDKLEAEIAKLEAALTDLRGQLYAATSDEERSRLNNEIDAGERAVAGNRAEIELIRNTPPPKPAKPGQKPKPAPAAPSAPSPS